LRHAATCALTLVVGLHVSSAAWSLDDNPATSPQPSAQTAPVAFEVASVKPNNSGQQGGQLRRQPGGRVEAVNIPLRQVITYAYQASPLTLAGGPNWISTDRFDITAKLTGDPPPVPAGAPDDIMLALRTLLADRFKLKVHRETRELDAYALVVARPGSIGPALTRSTQECSAEAVRSRAAGPPAAGGPAVLCGALLRAGRLQVGGLPLTGVLPVFSAQSGRNVVDRTGLNGVWDFELTFASAPGGPGAGAAPPPDDSAPSFFTAVQEQLGLRLEPTRAPIEMLVIDSVEHPTPD